MSFLENIVDSEWALPTLLGAWILSGAVAIGGAIYLDKIKAEIKTKFNTTYQTALLKYADKNHDGFVSSAENDAFDQDLLKDKGVTLVSDGWPIYKDGSSIPIKLMTKWIKEYKPSE